jgi:hypothetical protein
MSYDAMLEARNILNEKDICEACCGYGIYNYVNTGTWYSFLHPRSGRIVGQGFTKDVCYACWGSGNKNKPWPSWNKE